MRNINFNVSSLFGNAGTNNNTFDYGSFAMRKNGTYRKLLKSYYAEQKNYANEKKELEKQIDNEKSKAPTTKEVVVDKSLSVMKKEADGLKTAAEDLSKDDLWKQVDGKYDTDKISNAVKNFAKEYNDVVSQSAKVSSKEVSQSAKYMSDLTNVMSKTLKKIGVTVGTDGKMNVDEDALKQADMKDVKALFHGATSYGKQTAEKAGEIARATVMSGSLYSGNGAFTGASSNIFNQWI